MALEASKLKVEHKPLYIPPLQDIANGKNKVNVVLIIVNCSFSVLSTGLKANFARVNVEVVDSPDLTEKPFALASEGKCKKQTPKKQKACLCYATWLIIMQL